MMKPGVKQLILLALLGAIAIFVYDYMETIDKVRTIVLVLVVYVFFVWSDLKEAHKEIESQTERYEELSDEISDLKFQIEEIKAKMEEST